jgi:hypothetical protein
MPEASLNVDGHAADAESRGWIEALSSTGAEREDAVARLHELLVRASRFEIARRRRALGRGPAGDLEDLATATGALRGTRNWGSTDEHVGVRTGLGCPTDLSFSLAADELELAAGQRVSRAALLPT